MVNNVRFREVKNRVLKGQCYDAACLNCVHDPVYRTLGVGLHSNCMLSMTCQSSKTCRWSQSRRKTRMLEEKKTDQGLHMPRVLWVLLDVEKRLEATHPGQTLGGKGD
jgi:hypothetical protein